MPDIAVGAVVHPTAVLADDVVIEANAVVGPGVRLGAGVLVESCAVLGKRPRLRSGSSATGLALSDLVVGDGVTVCAGAVLYAGATIGDRVIIGDQAQVRERAQVGAGSVVGRGSCVDFGASVGAGVSIQTGVYVTSGAVVEDDVFLGPGVLMTNDDAMGRHPRGAGLSAPVIRRAARIGGGVVLVPGSRSVRRPSSEPAPWSRVTFAPALASWASRVGSSARCRTPSSSSTGVAEAVSRRR